MATKAQMQKEIDSLLDQVWYKGCEMSSLENDIESYENEIQDLQTENKALKSINERYLKIIENMSENNGN